MLCPRGFQADDVGDDPDGADDVGRRRAAAAASAGPPQFHGRREKDRAGHQRGRDLGMDVQRVLQGVTLLKFFQV